MSIRAHLALSDFSWCTFSSFSTARRPAGALGGRGHGGSRRPRPRTGGGRRGHGAPGCRQGPEQASGCSPRWRRPDGHRPGTRRRTGAAARRASRILVKWRTASAGRPASSAAMAAARRRSRSFTCARSWDTTSDLDVLPDGTEGAAAAVADDDEKLSLLHGRRLGRPHVERHRRSCTVV
jgi:hypothetical protein